jgi:uncharacterized protein (UPF0276 family)
VAAAAAAAAAVAEVAAMNEIAGIARMDRVGLGWRGELAAGIFIHLDRIDLVEVIADDHFRASSRELRAFRTLAAQIPVTLHGVSMGLASALPVESRRIDNMARLVDALRPVSWSEHLAFVRGGGVEIGHLAAPPRCVQSVDSAVANIERATRIVGAAPLMENIATLIEPPVSTLAEGAWISNIIAGSDASLLLDLHNLYANALNFGADPAELLLSFPLHKVGAVHLSGGKWVPEPAPSQRMRLLDDHVHDVPPAVYALLELLATHAPQPLDVIVERDGRYPAFESLLAQLDAARTALCNGRKTAAVVKRAA